MCDIAEVYLINKRRARKRHKCRECRGDIQTGEHYYYHHGVFDGSGFGFQICPDCESLRQELNTGRNHYDQICVEELGEAVFECGLDFQKRFVENKRKRGAAVPDWMLQRIAG